MENSLIRLFLRRKWNELGSTKRPFIFTTLTHKQCLHQLYSLFSVIAAQDLDMKKSDVRNTFLQPLLEEKMFIEQPEGFILPGREQEVCRLKRSLLHGLNKQAPHVSGEPFASFLKAHSFESCTSMPLYSLERGRSAHTWPSGLTTPSLSQLNSQQSTLFWPLWTKISR